MAKAHDSIDKCISLHEGSGKKFQLGGQVNKGGESPGAVSDDIAIDEIQAGGIIKPNQQQNVMGGGEPRDSIIPNFPKPTPGVRGGGAPGPGSEYPIIPHPPPGVQGNIGLGDNTGIDEIEHGGKIEEESI